MSETADSNSLAALRREIDDIDAEMHRLLIRRGEIIDRLISVKRTRQEGGAFRPAREAEMMRRLAARHRGPLPLDTVESIWRVIISTFTYLQAPYRVHADVAAGDAAMRDVARFHFGFTVPFVPQQGVGATIAAVEASEGDLGIVPAAAPGAWWSALSAPPKPKIIARLPFVERADHPAALPVFVVAKAVDRDAAAEDVRMLALDVTGWSEATEARIAALGGSVSSRDLGTGGFAAVLLSLPGSVDEARIGEAVAASGARVTDLNFVGSHAARTVLADRRESERAS